MKYMPCWKLWVYKSLNSWTVVSCWMTSVHLWTQNLPRAVFWLETCLKNAQNRARLLWCVLTAYLLGRAHETNLTFHTPDLPRDGSSTHLGLVFWPTIPPHSQHVFIIEMKCVVIPVCDLKWVSNDEEGSLTWERIHCVWEKYVVL